MRSVKFNLNTEIKRQILRFVIVGLIATAIQYAVYFLMQLVLSGHLGLNISMTVGYIVSVICNFYLTTYFTFSSKASVRKAAGFGMSHVVNYTLQIAFFNLFSFLGAGRLVAPVLAMGCAMPVNFTILHFVYSRKGHTKDS